VLPGGKVGCFDTQLARHPQMDAEPDATRESKRDLLAARLRTEQFFPGERRLDPVRIASSKDTVFTMQLQAEDPLTDAIVPAPAEIFNFGKLGHS